MEGYPVWNRYNFSMRFMHWVVGVAILVMLGVGIYMKGLSSDVGFKYIIYDVHKIAGVFLFPIILLRILIRVLSQIPESPKNISYCQYFFARIVHYAMYVAIFLMPISGYVMSSASGRPLVLNFPMVIPKNPAIASMFHSVHTFLGYSIIFLVTLHILGFLKHYFFDKVNILKRIT